MVAVVAAVVVCWQVIHRASLLVHRWAPSSFQRHGAGPLSVLDSGPTGRDDERIVVLLHGLGATGDYFGAFYDGLSRRNRVVIVDLVGFGHSLDETRSEFGVNDHVAAIDAALDSLAVTNQRIVLAAHSMSAAIALTFADRHRECVEHVSSRVHRSTRTRWPRWPLQKSTDPWAACTHSTRGGPSAPVA